MRLENENLTPLTSQDEGGETPGEKEEGADEEKEKEKEGEGEKEEEL